MSWLWFLEKVRKKRMTWLCIIINPIQEFKKDPEHAQCYVDFCDSLQAQGYSLEDAIIGTDIIFDQLKNESTYHS